MMLCPNNAHRGKEMYEVYIKYDDGFEFTKTFENLGEAKSYFHNVDVGDIEISTLCETNADGKTEIARKEAKKKKTEPAAE
jgi:hypothetical protein